MELNDKEKFVYNTISKIVDGSLTRKEAMFELNKSRQQIYRLINIYNKEGEQGFIHKNRGKESEKKMERSIIDELESLYLTEYYDYNFIAFYDELTENEKYKDKYAISYSTLYNEFLNDDIVSPLAHKETVKLYNERMNNAIVNKEEFLLNKLILEDLVICLDLGKRFKWMLVKKFGLVTL